MRIRSIIIENFRNIEHLEIRNIEQSLALFGLVGQGKTSVLEAIRMALLGECELSGELAKKGGGGVKRLVRDGAKMAFIELVVDPYEDGHDDDNDIRIQLTIPTKGKVDCFFFDNEGEKFPCYPSIWEMAGIPFNHARVSMMPGRFLLSTELGDILAEFLSADIDPDDLQKLAGTHADWLAEYAKGHDEALDSVTSFENMGTYAFQWRTQVKKNIAETEADIEAIGHVVAPKDLRGNAMEVDHIEQLVWAVSATKKELADALVEKGRAEVAEDADSVEQRRWELTNEHKKLCEISRDFGSRLEEAKLEVEAAEQARTKGQRNHSEAAVELKKLQSEIKEVKCGIESLKDEDGACPRCGRKYTAAHRKTELASLQTRLYLAVEGQQFCQSGVDRKLKELKPLHDDVSAAVDDVDTIRGEMNLNQNDIAGVVRARDELPEANTARALLVVEEEIEALEEKIERGRDYIERLTKMKEKDAKTKRNEEAAIELDHLNWCVEAFKDGAAIKELISGGLDDFTNRCNAELEPGGYELSIEVSGKKVGVMLRCPGQKSRPVALCSSGQQALAQAAVAFAFSDSGAPVLLDNLNDLDGPFRKAVLRRIQAETDLTVIAAGAWQQNDQSMEGIRKALAPMRVLWIQDGAL